MHSEAGEQNINLVHKLLQTLSFCKVAINSEEMKGTAGY